MKLYQTTTSKKTGLWHIAQKDTDGSMGSYCNNSWWNSKHSNRPKPKIVDFKELENGQRLCPSCVGQAYIKGIINVKENA